MRLHSSPELLGDNLPFIKDTITFFQSYNDCSLFLEIKKKLFVEILSITMGAKLRFAWDIRLFL